MRATRKLVRWSVARVDTLRQVSYLDLPYAAVAVVACVCWALPAWAMLAQDPSPVERFIASLDEAGLGDDGAIPAEAVALIRESWSKCGDCDAEEFLTQGLALVSPKFRDGLDAYNADRNEACAATMKELTGDSNPLIAISAAAYEIKALVALDRLADAGARITRLLGEDSTGGQRVADYSYFLPEISFLRGYCLVANLQHDEAVRAIAGFLDEYPDASPRLVVAARQMMAELENRQEGRIGEVVDLMDFSGRRLRHGDSGSGVQERQVRVIEILDGLIEEAEEQEQSGDSSSNSGGGSGGSGKGSRSPMQDSSLPGGSSGEDTLRSHRRANPAEQWGDMPPTERQRILQALRDNFPSRYRLLVEQYYEQLAKKP